MEGNHCRLFDENLVRNIMISTGMSIFEYVKDNASAGVTEICDFIEMNADTIIWNTIEDMNNAGDFADNGTAENDQDSDDGHEDSGPSSDVGDQTH